MFAGMLQTRREHPVASCPSCSITAQLHWHAWDDLSSSAPPGILSSGKHPCASRGAHYSESPKPCQRVPPGHKAPDR